jgi:hypothetical protein
MYGCFGCEILTHFPCGFDMTDTSSWSESDFKSALIPRPCTLDDALPVSLLLDLRTSEGGVGRYIPLGWVSLSAFCRFCMALANSSGLPWIVGCLDLWGFNRPWSALSNRPESDRLDLAVFVDVAASVSSGGIEMGPLNACDAFLNSDEPFCRMLEPGEGVRSER